MHIINDNEGEERLSQLVSAAREEKLLVSVDEVAKSLSVSASLTPSATAVKAKLTIIHKVTIVLLTTLVSILTVYYFHQRKPEVAINAPDKVVEKKVTSPLQNVKVENPVEKETHEDIKKPEENAMTGPKKENVPKEIFHFDGTATVVFDFKDQHVKMIAGDKVESLNIDNININEKDFNKYEAVIQYGLDIKKEQDQKRITEENHKSTANKVIMQALLDKLSGLNLIKEGEGFDFYLKGTSALLNASELTNDQFLILKNTYEETTGKSLPAKANIHIKH